MLKATRTVLIYTLVGISPALAQRYDCPDVPLWAVNPKDQTNTWTVQPSAPTSLEFEDGRLVCRYGNVVMSLELTPKNCTVQANGAKVVKSGGRTLCVPRKSWFGSFKEQCFLECAP